MFKRVVGYILSAYYDKHDKSAFNMKYDTELQKERMTAFKNYYLPPEDIKLITLMASNLAEKEKTDVAKRYRFHTVFFSKVIQHKWEKLVRG